MSVPPSLIHLRPGQHPSGSTGRNQTKVGRRTKKGAHFYLNGLRQSSKFCSLTVLLSKAADVQLVNGKEKGEGGRRRRRGCDSHSPTNPRCAAASCQRTQVCKECLECRTNLLDLFPFNCLVDPAAGRVFPETCTEYIATSYRKVQSFQLCTQEEINVIHGSKVFLLCQTRIVQKLSCVIEEVYCAVNIHRHVSREEKLTRLSWCQMCGGARLRGCCRRSVWQCCSERRSRLLPRDHRLPKV